MKERRSYLLFLFWPERSFCKRIPFLWCVSEPNIDYRIDVASFRAIWGPKGIKEEELRQYTIKASKAWQKPRQMWSTLGWAAKNNIWRKNKYQSYESKLWKTICKFTYYFHFLSTESMLYECLLLPGLHLLESRGHAKIFKCDYESLFLIWMELCQEKEVM